MKELLEKLSKVIEASLDTDAEYIEEYVDALETVIDRYTNAQYSIERAVNALCHAVDGVKIGLEDRKDQKSIEFIEEVFGNITEIDNNNADLVNNERLKIMVESIDGIRKALADMVLSKKSLRDI